MILSNEEQTLFDEGILLSTEKLVISKVMVDDEDDYQFSADCYVTTDEDDENKGYLHLRLFDGTSDSFDPSISYKDCSVSDVVLEFYQEGDEDYYRFVYNTMDGVNLFLSNGNSERITSISNLTGLSLTFAAKIFFVDVLKVILNQE